MSTKNTFSESSLADDPVSGLLEALPEEAFIIDLNGTVINANTRFASRFGISPEECLGVVVYDLIKTRLPEQAVVGSAMCEEVLLTGRRTV
jgi:PAS domain S-box-containing protein